MAGEVTPRGSGDERLPAPELRASHEDRDRAVELLRMAAGDGRLSADELDQRLEAALTARTYGELAVLTRDLLAAPSPATVADPKDLIRIESGSGSARRDGRWVITAAALWIDAEMNSGSLTLITRPGIVVDTDDVTVRSGSVRVRPPGDAPAPALLNIHVSGKIGSGSVRARGPRRTFWQWLLRRPKPR